MSPQSPFMRRGVASMALLGLCMMYVLLMAVQDSVAGPSTDPAGKPLYEQHCAVCHEASSVTHAPTRDALKAFSPEAVMRALSGGGIMEVPGRAVTAREKTILASYLTGKPFGAEAPKVPKAAWCTSSERVADTATEPHWNGWGVDGRNTRFQSESMAKLSAADLPRLRLKWVFAFPQASVARAQPAILGGRLFIGSAIRTVYSLDAKTGCVHWAFDAAGNVRTGIELARPSAKERLLAYFGDERSNVYGVDATTGKLVWKVRLETDPAIGITGTPKVYHRRVFIPIIDREDIFAAAGNFECCKKNGALVALDARTGTQLWRTNTVPDPQQTGANPDGVPAWGPSGASIWSSPTLDPKRDVVYVTTGDNHSNPATLTSDAVLALDTNTGRMLWAHQFTAADSFNVGCIDSDTANCPNPAGPDYDFGSSAMLVDLPDGRRLLIAGQKSGVVHAIDPDDHGRVVWETRVSAGGIIGGIEWGMATDGITVFAPISDMGFVMDPSRNHSEVASYHVDREKGGGLIALDAATGTSIWQAPPIPCPIGNDDCSPAQAAAATAIPGAVFSGSISGHIRAYSNSAGAVIWDFDTVQDYIGIGGVKGRGGSLNGPGPVVVDRMVYVTSGYDLFGSPGNVLLAFGLE